VSDLEQMVVEVEQRFVAPPDAVFALLHDVSRMAGLGPEHERAEWVNPTLFTGWNRVGDHAWETPCHVTVDDPPRGFAWTVGTPGRQSSTWTYELSPEGAGTRVVQRFRHGPGASGLRDAIERNPERAEDYVTRRGERLRQNMGIVLERAAALLREG
jgi:hypothetical protein